MVLAQSALPSAILAGIGTLSFAWPLASRIETLIAEADDEQVRLEALRASRQLVVLTLEPVDSGRKGTHGEVE